MILVCLYLNLALAGCSNLDVKDVEYYVDCKYVRVENKIYRTEESNYDPFLKTYDVILSEVEEDGIFYTGFEC